MTQQNSAAPSANSLTSFGCRSYNRFCKKRIPGPLKRHKFVKIQGLLRPARTKIYGKISLCTKFQETWEQDSKLIKKPLRAFTKKIKMHFKTLVWEKLLMHHSKDFRRRKLYKATLISSGSVYVLPFTGITAKNCIYHSQDISTFYGTALCCRIWNACYPLLKVLGASCYKSVHD